MDEQKQIDLLREALTGAVVTLTEVYKYAHMDSRTLQKDTSKTGTLGRDVDKSVL